MSHHTVQSGYRDLVLRLNKFPQGAPPSRLLYDILSLLFSEEEASLLSRLPVRPFSAAKAAGVWGKPEAEAQKILEGLASRGHLLDLEQDGVMLYLLPPPMAGFFEFSLMRVRRNIDQKRLSELFYQYLNVEEDFIKALFCGGETQIGRVFVNEEALPERHSSRVLDYERASEVIGSASAIAVGMCYCRHKMSHVGKGCDAPLDICMTLNGAAESLIRHGSARQVDAVEGLDLLQDARDRNLVQCGDNVQDRVNFICHCCSCCCEALLAVRRLAIPSALYSTNFLPVLSPGNCTGCGACVSLCPVAALSPESGTEGGKPRCDEKVCLGCGVCVRSCPREGLALEPRAQRVITPVNSAHRVVLMAIERGTLQHLIFDNQAHLSHRVMAAVLGAILKLSPVKQALAARQLKSRYLARLLANVEVATFSD
ncbi:4Fe-4S binding protein [Geomonas sp. RF6]|uniref:4Fe-4S dicluster domain-containing protein n=1 Tax=Geomonas sp. RF6 TaxID=2897342 RepID=UPI001E5E51E2|nr:4Fe-4S binding protein [Geomonas sp. RF6]UFS72140.1 4Fe-4S binding protein [Geomonas sp. RF6]